MRLAERTPQKPPLPAEQLKRLPSVAALADGQPLDVALKSLHIRPCVLEIVSPPRKPSRAGFAPVPSFFERIQKLA